MRETPNEKRTQSAIASFEDARGHRPGKVSSPWRLRTNPNQQPARKLRPQSYHHLGLRFVNSLSKPVYRLSPRVSERNAA